jgi:hypothetical protein
VRVHEAQKGEFHMKQTAMLTTASLATILLMTFHLTGDILFKMSPAGLVNLFAVFVFVVQLYGTLVLGGRRAGYIIIFLGSVLGLLMPVLHMKGTRGVIGGDTGNSGQAFLFVWTLPRVGNNLDVLPHPIGERTVEFAMAPEPPDVNCRITPDCGIRPATGTRPEVPRRHLDVSMTHRFFRRDLKKGLAVEAEGAEVDR